MLALAVVPELGGVQHRRLFERDGPVDRLVWISGIDHEMEEWFDHLVLSAEVGVMNPDMEIYLMASDLLNVRPEESPRREVS